MSEASALIAANDLGLDPTFTPKVILVVDDEVLIRMAISEYLRECGFLVFEAADGEEAVTILQASERPVDLVFSDCQMPRMDGFSLARWVREHRPDVRIILTSGNPALFAEKAADLCQLGPLEEKPYDHVALARRIHEMIARASMVP